MPRSADALLILAWILTVILTPVGAIVGVIGLARGDRRCRYPVAVAFAICAIALVGYMWFS